MRNIIKYIKFSPIGQFFTEAELSEMIRIINPKECECYRNNWIFALLAKRKYPSIECCEGVYDNLYVHFFNSIVVNGKMHFIDFSGYFLQKKYGYELSGYAIVLRQFNACEIKAFIDKNGFMGCTIERDGTYRKFVDKMCSKYGIDKPENHSRDTHLLKMSRKSEVVYLDKLYLNN